MEKRIANVEKNMASNVVTMETSMKNIKERMVRNAANVERNTADMEEKLEAVDNKVTGLKTALIEGFIEMKDVLIKMEDRIEENKRKVRNTPSGDRENIIVAGGWGTKTVKMFNWRQGTWSPLQSIQKYREGATSFVFNNHVTIAGGYHAGSWFDDMIRMNIHPNPDLSMQWSDCPVKLPTKLAYHSSVLYNDHLIVSGGHNGDRVSDCIHDVQLVPPYTVKTLSRMLQPRQYHCMERFDDSLLILGGTTGREQDCLSSVVLYDIKKNECKELAQLPYEVSDMATVKWGDNIVVMGGRDIRGKKLGTVIMYNVKTEQYHMLPAMKCKRVGGTAVVVGNNIVVLGGVDERWQEINSVEVFNFESYTWQELSEMSETRWYHTAVVV
jgi:WD40 repeat protein